MNDYQRKLYERALGQWGTAAQVGMFVEECGEALTAIAKYGRNHNGSTKAQIANELADLQIMVNQMIVAFGISQEFYEALSYKHVRLEKRLAVK